MIPWGFRDESKARWLADFASKRPPGVTGRNGIMPRHVYMLNNTEATIERGDVLYGPSESGGVSEIAWHASRIATSISGAESDAKSLCIPLHDILPGAWGHVAVNGWVPAKTGSGTGYWGMPDGGVFKMQASGMVFVGAAVAGEENMHWVNLDMHQPLWRVSVGESSNTLKDWSGTTFATSGFTIEDPDSFFTGSTKLYVQHMMGRGMYFAAIAGNCPPPPE